VGFYVFGSYIAELIESRSGICETSNSHAFYGNSEIGLGNICEQSEAEVS
jgi:hypothetical protein